MKVLNGIKVEAIIADSLMQWRNEVLHKDKDKFIKNKTDSTYPFPSIYNEDGEERLLRDVPL